MQKKPTGELNNILGKAKPDQLDQYFKENKEYMADPERGFYYYMSDVLKEKNIKQKDVYSFAGFTESYGGQLLRMEKRTRDRDKIIRLCIAGHFSWDETNRALKLYGMSELYAKNERDACIIVAINNRRYSMSEVDDLLMQQGFQKLTEDE